MFGKLFRFLMSTGKQQINSNIDHRISGGLEWCFEHNLIYMEFLFFGLLEGVDIFFVAFQLALEVEVLPALVAHHRLLLKRET